MYTQIQNKVYLLWPFSSAINYGSKMTINMKPSNQPTQKAKQKQTSTSLRICFNIGGPTKLAIKWFFQVESVPSCTEMATKNKVKTEHVCPYKKIYCHVKFHTAIESGAHFVFFLFLNLYCFVTDYRCADVLHLCVCWVLGCVRIPSAFVGCRMCACWTDCHCTDIHSTQSFWSWGAVEQYCTLPLPFKPMLVHCSQLCNMLIRQSNKHQFKSITSLF